MDNKNWSVKAIEDFASLSEVFDDIHWDTKNGGLSMTAKKDGQVVFGMGVLADGDTASCMPERVIYRNDTTVAIFPDGTKTTSRPMAGEEYDKEVGLAMCIAKRVCGGRKAFLEVVESAEIQYEKPVKKKNQPFIAELKPRKKPYWCEFSMALDEGLGCHDLQRGRVTSIDAIACKHCDYSLTRVSRNK